MVSLGTLIYLAARSLPRVSETDLKPDSLSNVLDRMVKKIPLEKADAAASYYLEVLLRRFKVIVLKLDNLLTKHLQNLKPPAETSKPNLFDGSANLTINPEDSRRIEKKEEPDNLNK